MDWLEKLWITIAFAGYAVLSYILSFDNTWLMVVYKTFR